MKRKVLSVLSMILSIAIMLSFTVQAKTENNDSAIHKILSQWQEGINSKDLNKYLSVFDDTMQKSLKLSIETAKEEDKKYLQFYAIKNVEYKNIERVSLDDIYYYDLSGFENAPSEVYYFYFDAETNSNMETKYTTNGRNFAFCILTKQSDSWKISQFSVADVESFIAKGIDLGTTEEANIKLDIQERQRKIKALKEGATDFDKYAESIGIMTAIPEPTYVRVCCRSDLKYNNQTNYQYWGVAKGTAANVPFQYYIKDVLPNEWDSDIVVPNSSDSSQNLQYALYAGALMVKTFSWYMTIHPWNSANGFDVNDDMSQLYLHNTRTKQSADGRGVLFNWGQLCQNTFNTYGEVSNYIIYDWDQNEPLYAKYVQSQMDRTYYLDGTMGYATYGIIYDIYHTMYPSKNFSLRDYTN